MSKNLLAAAVSAAVLFASPFSAAQADEGVVTVYMPSPTGLNAKYVAQFEKQTGIKVKLFEGTTGKILARLEAEKAIPLPTSSCSPLGLMALPSSNPAFSLRTRTPKC